MTKKNLLIFTLILIFMAFLTIFSSAEALSVNTNETYSTGEPVLIMISSEEKIDPANLKVVVTKPDGAEVETAPRRQTWNEENECFETYTIDQNGTYTVSIFDVATGETATTTFAASVFDHSSKIFMVIAVIIFICSMITWILKLKKKTA